MAADDDSLNDYEIVVKARDTGGNTRDLPVTVTVTNVNETPELTGTVTETVSYFENNGIDVAAYTARDEEGGVTWRLTGVDSGDFAIDSGGVVTFAARPNFEAPVDSDTDNVYTFTVVATDILSGSTRLSDSVDVTVTVVDVGEEGKITVDNSNPAVDDVLRFELSDPDGGIVTGPSPGGFSWIIQTRTSDSAAWVSGDIENTGELYIEYLVDEDEAGLQVRAVVDSYTDRRGPGQNAESEATAAITAESHRQRSPTVPRGRRPVFPGGRRRQTRWRAPEGHRP